MPKTALTVDSASPGVPDLAADLAAVGVHVLGACTRDKLVHEAIRLQPDMVVCVEPSVDEVFFEACASLATTAPRAVVVFTDDPDASKIERALQSGIHAYVVGGYALNRLRPVIHLANARFQREHTLRSELAELTRRFDERKLVDRAKGILMRARQVSEEDAFRTLRTAAMHSKRRVGQVSQQVISAAHYADAVNRAGRLRMLAQRLVKLAALRLLAPTDIGHAQLLAESIGLIDSQIEALGKSLSRPTFGDLLEAVETAWPPLRQLVDRTALDSAEMETLDALAEHLLAQAEQLTRHLETAGLVTTLHVINVSGRQRMWSQRYAKLALLGVLFAGEPGQRARAEMAQTAHAFEVALEYLKTIPLTTREIRDALGSADRTWAALQGSAREARSAAGQRSLANDSEALLTLFDLLTDQYERSMQMLMG